MSQRVDLIISCIIDTKKERVCISCQTRYTRKSTLCDGIKLCKDGGCFRTDFACWISQQIQGCNLNFVVCQLITSGIQTNGIFGLPLNFILYPAIILFMFELIAWFLIGVFLFNACKGIAKKGCYIAIRTWPFDHNKTKRVLYKSFIGFFIYLTFAAFLSAFLKIFHIDV